MAHKDTLKSCTVQISMPGGVFDPPTKQAVEGVCYRGLALTPNKGHGAWRQKNPGWVVTHVETGSKLPLHEVVNGKTRETVFRTQKTGIPMLKKLGDAFEWEKYDPERGYYDAMLLLQRVTGYNMPDSERIEYDKYYEDLRASNNWPRFRPKPLKFKRLSR